MIGEELARADLFSDLPGRSKPEVPA